MKTSVLFSGSLRTFKICYPTFLKYIINPLNSDIFMYVPYQSDIKDIIKDVKNDSRLKDFESFEESVLYKKKYKRRRNGVERVLRLLTYLKKVNMMKSNYEKKNNFIYDWVIRCRCDTLILSKNSLNLNLSKNIIYIPSHNHSSGVNDRFAVGSSKLMNLYNNRINWLDDFYNHGGTIHSETFLLSYIEKMKILISPLKNFYVQILRLSGEKIGPDIRSFPKPLYISEKWCLHIFPTYLNSHLNEKKI